MAWDWGREGVLRGIWGSMAGVNDSTTFIDTPKRASRRAGEDNMASDGWAVDGGGSYLTAQPTRPWPRRIKDG